MLGFKPLPPEAVKAVDPQVQILDSPMDTSYACAFCLDLYFLDH